MRRVIRRWRSSELNSGQIIGLSMEPSLMSARKVAEKRHFMCRTILKSDLQIALDDNFGRSLLPH